MAHELNDIGTALRTALKSGPSGLGSRCYVCYHTHLQIQAIQTAETGPLFIAAPSPRARLAPHYAWWPSAHEARWHQRRCQCPERRWWAGQVLLTQRAAWWIRHGGGCPFRRAGARQAKRNSRLHPLRGTGFHPLSLLLSLRLSAARSQSCQRQAHLRLTKALRLALAWS